MSFSVVFHDHIKTTLSRIFNEVLVPNTVIEIGCFEGETTFNLTAMLRGSGAYKHYAIDPFGEPDRRHGGLGPRDIHQHPAAVSRG